MDFAFLRDFPKRMRVVGLYALLIDKSSQKQIWKNLGFTEFDEQITILFSILLFIMEKSLRDENCTIDDISDFLHDLNNNFFKKSITHEDCQDLAQIVIDDVLSNGGRIINFLGYDYNTKEYKPITINYIANKIIYENKESRRSSYYLDEDGYSLLLGTLEIESHMRLTIQEMIFTEHLKKNNYDKSLDDIKNIFEFIRIEKKKNIEALSRIRQNILNFTIDEYSDRIDATFNTIRETRQKLENHKLSINERVDKIQNESINLDHINEEDLKSLKKLNEISHYLDRAIECHLDIMKSYNDYRDMCTQEMEKFLKISLVERFSFSKEIFERILDNPKRLEFAFNFLHPMFNKDPIKSLNLNKVFVPQYKHEKNKQPSTIENIDFDEKNWRDEQRKQQEEKNKQYKTCLLFILECTRRTKKTTLADISASVANDEKNFARLIPNISIFKEIMIELIHAGTINIDQLKIDRANHLIVNSMQNNDDVFNAKQFNIGDVILEIIEENASWNSLSEFTIKKIYPEEKVQFTGSTILTYDDHPASIICTNVMFNITFS